MLNPARTTKATSLHGQNVKVIVNCKNFLPTSSSTTRVSEPRPFPWLKYHLWVHRNMKGFNKL